MTQTASLLAEVSLSLSNSHSASKQQHSQILQTQLSLAQILQADNDSFQTNKGKFRLSNNSQ
jgi:hypothetical protein